MVVPDLSEDGPLAEVYRVCVWIAIVLLGMLGVGQLIVSMFQRNGKGLGRLIIGFWQFVLVWAGGIGVAVTSVAAAGGLTSGLVEILLGVDQWSENSPVGEFDFASAGVEVAVAFVLAVLGIFIVLAAIGHFFLMLARGGALAVLLATSTISAAGLVTDMGQGWFWKSARWFVAAAMSPPLVVLMRGIGAQLTSGVATGDAAEINTAVGSAFIGTMLILVSAVAPLALFRLLAFVDPSTSSGASMRAGLAAAGGIAGVLGSGGAPVKASSAATQMSSSGDSQDETQSDESNMNRFGSMFSKYGGILGEAAGQGIGAFANAGSQLASGMTDEMNQAGVGQGIYFPDQPSSQRQSKSPDQREPNKPDNDDPGPNDNGPPPVPPGDFSPPSPGPNSSAPDASAADSSSAAEAAEIPPVA